MSVKQARCVKLVKHCIRAVRRILKHDRNDYKKAVDILKIPFDNM